MPTRKEASWPGSAQRRPQSASSLSGGPRKRSRPRGQVDIHAGLAVALSCRASALGQTLDPAALNAARQPTPRGCAQILGELGRIGKTLEPIASPSTPGQQMRLPELKKGCVP